MAKNERLGECVDLAGTAIAINGRAALLRGPSGSGKSDLAFRLVEQEGARLVGDDHVDLYLQKGDLIVQENQGWQGKLELRGLGIVTLPAVEEAKLALVVDLVAREQVPRLPDPAFEMFHGIKVPRLALHSFDTTTPAKLCIALATLSDKGFPGDDGFVN